MNDFTKTDKELSAPVPIRLYCYYLVAVCLSVFMILVGVALSVTPERIDSNFHVTPFLWLTLSVSANLARSLSLFHFKKTGIRVKPEEDSTIVVVTRAVAAIFFIIGIAAIILKYF